MHGHLRFKTVFVVAVAAESIVIHNLCSIEVHLWQLGVLGQPEDKGMLYWFQALCQWLESEDAELYTLNCMTRW